MRHELKAIFDDRSKAQQALDELLVSGYPQADMRLVTVSGMRPGYGGEASAPRWRERPETSSARLLSRVLGLADSRAETPDAGPMPADSHILTLATDSAEEAKIATSLIAGFMRYADDETGSGLSAPLAGMHDVSRRSTAVPGALQFARRGASHYFGDRNTDDPAGTGTTWKEPMLAEGFWPGALPGGAVLRDEHTGSSVADRGASGAFRFGRDMHEDERFRNRAWCESDADLKRLWEASGADRPGWDASAPAVRQGWSSTHPEIDDDSYHRSHWRTSYPDTTAEARDLRRPGRGAPAGATGSAGSRGHRATATAWKHFVDTVRHGWNRTGIGPDPDETAYRLHHARTYPGTSYEELAPVYRFGHHARARSMFQGRDWDEVEDALRAAWELDQGGGQPASWDEIRAALRAGWDDDGR
ncbi:hypothetical protein LE190_04635 [Massilia oculi]|uniref:Uncharacterized protein n=1 Tax=Massilia hydrophila TaxID=3044279 RepID=A0ABS7Y695_9BURK|nr:hypothetical protein [Massilia oculi]MCA1855210.1 hypothetical protein [Massilia oculi]